MSIVYCIKMRASISKAVDVIRYFDGPDDWRDTMRQSKPVGFWFMIITGFLLLVILLLGQTMAFIDYDFAVSIGLQEAVGVMGEMGVATNKGFGVGDTIIYIPLLLLGLVGLLSGKRWGLYAMAGAMAITAYWPVTCIFILIYAKGVPGFHFTNYVSYSIILTLFMIYGLWGLWYLYRQRDALVKIE